MGTAGRPRQVLNALIIGTIAAVAVVAVVLVIGYGPGRVSDALYVTGLATMMLLLPFGVSCLGRAMALRWSAPVTNVDVLLWLLVSLAAWWLLPTVLLPSGSPGMFGLVLAAVPLSIQVVVAAWWLTRTSRARGRTDPQRR